MSRQSSSAARFSAPDSRTRSAAAPAGPAGLGASGGLRLARRASGSRPGGGRRDVGARSVPAQRCALGLHVAGLARGRPPYNAARPTLALCRCPAERAGSWQAPMHGSVRGCASGAACSLSPHSALRSSCNTPVACKRPARQRQHAAQCCARARAWAPAAPSLHRG